MGERGQNDGQKLGSTGAGKHENVAELTTWCWLSYNSQDHSGIPVLAFGKKDSQFCAALVPVTCLICLTRTVGKSVQKKKRKEENLYQLARKRILGSCSGSMATTWQLQPGLKPTTGHGFVICSLNKRGHISGSTFSRFIKKKLSR